MKTTLFSNAFLRTAMIVLSFGATSFALAYDNSDKPANNNSSMTTTESPASYTAAPTADSGIIDKTEQAGSDAWITTKVKSAYIKDKLTKAHQIEVDTQNGVVTLTGQVESQAAIDRAVELAKETKGVTSVNSTSLVVIGSGAK